MARCATIRTRYSLPACYASLRLGGHVDYDSGWEHDSAICALADFTVGVAIFGRDGRCRALNQALALLAREPAASLVGKTLSEICGVEDSALQAALLHVTNTREPLRGLKVTVHPAGRGDSRTWITDVFPLHNTGGGLDLVGVSVSDVTATSRLQQLYFERCIPTPPDLMWSDGSSARHLTELSARYRDVFRRSVGLLNRSMCIRREMSQIRIEMRLSRTAIRMRTQMHLQQEDTRRTRRAAYPRLPQANGDVPPSTIGAPKPAELGEELPSPRELQVLRLVAEGRSNKQIGVDLSLSTRTIETYRARLMFKLKVHSSAELIRYAIRNQFVHV